MVRPVDDVREQTASWQIWLVSLLLASMPMFFALSSRIKALPILVLCLVGLSALVSRQETRRACWLAWPVGAVCLLRLLYDIGNFAGHRLGWSSLDLPAQTLLFVLIAAAFSLPLKQRVIAIGFSMTAIVLGVVCLIQRYAQGIDRPYGLNGGDWAAVEFGMYLLLLVLLSMLQALRPDTPPRDRWLHAVAVAIGLYGAVLTQSRGPLLAFAPIYLGLMFWIGLRTRRWRRMIGLLAITVAGMLAVTATLHREMVNRLADVPVEMASYGPDDTTGAVRERLEMWRIAWQAFSEHPLTGIGLDQFGVYVRQQAAAGNASEAIAKYVHPHSEYFESLVAGGLPALLVLLMFFGVPLVFFARRLNHPKPEVAGASAAGLMVIVMYGLCAFSDNVFYRAMPHSLYLFLVLGLAVVVGRELRQPSAG